ncbi:PREDICTED: chymotrypsin-like elastase family member 2A [Nicrophorus vespilloides]|uniref:Chymotrypsin-like elastase family member 2A n=1 Tax=Nicrophorus vespilloides TaxID=110193 RepID=A0ABM1MS11_NICVS|nr:PREDICTED: chymotrypsin-like elastase family member 2A [Nicrophorus vespilloides]
MLKFTLLVFIAVSALAFANSLPGEKSKKYCRETHVAKSGRVRRIIGGEIAAPNEFPHTVALIYIENGKRVWNCAGILITDKYVLTGATCIDM